MKKLTKTLLSASLAAMGVAHAQGLSVGGSLGTSHYKGDAIGGLSTDRSGDAGKVYGGYSFSPNFGLELGYATLGKFSSAADSLKGKGAYLDAVGTWPLGTKVSLLGRVGAFGGRLESGLAGATDSGTNVKVGAGLQYDVDRNLGVRGEWERYRFDAFGSKANTDLYSIGVNYRF
ncbi:MAG TPA: outer membrane beta-barrel protein [Burkholderiaceae bacterium]|nr:outer membrane beta-barrel protein [Burkholderiaceae bacterium]